MWHASVLTLFPEMFPGGLSASIPGRALENGIWKLDTIQIRDFASGNHKAVDDTPFGGGAGMVMKPDVLHEALSHAHKQNKGKRKIIYMSPRCKPLKQNDLHKNLRTYPDGAIILCGRYEGVDQRVIDYWKENHDLEEVSIGDYILSGGELGAQVYLDATVRLLDNAVGAKESLQIESFELDLLEFSQYTRPYVWNNIEVPEVLVSGNHQKIDTFREQQSYEITKKNRPDLWEIYKKKNPGCVR